MADSKLPDINSQLDALPFDEATKDGIYNAFYAVDEKQAKAALDSLNIPGKIKNDFYQLRYNSLYKTDQTPKPPTKQEQAKPEGPGILERAEKNLPRSGANFIKGLGTAAADMSTMGLPRLADAASRVINATANGGIKGGLEQGVTETFAPIIGMAKHVAGRIMHPMESFAEDPVGMTADVAAVAAPIIGARGSIANAAKAGVEALPKKAPVTPKPGSPPAAPGLMDTAVNVFNAVRNGFKGTEPPPSAPPKPVEPGSQRTGPITQHVNSKKTTKVEGTQPLFDKSKRKPEPEAPPVVEKKPLMLASGPPPKPVPGLSTEAPRFYASQSGEVLDSANPPQPVTPKLESGPQPSASHQLTQPEGPKGLLPEAPENPAQIDVQALSTEYKVHPDAIYRFSQLDIPTLEHVAHQADTMVKEMLSKPEVDPVALAKASESSRAARAVLQQKSYYIEGTRSPLEYSTSKAPIPGNAPDVALIAEDINARHAESLKPEVVPPQKPVKAAQPKPQPPAEPVAQPKPAPAPEPIPEPVPVVEPVIEPVTEPALPPAPKKPKNAPPRSKKADKSAVAPAEQSATTPVPAKASAATVAEAPVTPAATVTAEAPKVETVSSPVPQQLTEPTPAPAPVPAPVTKPATPKPAAASFTESVPRNGKASYQSRSGNGQITVKPGERMFYRDDAQGFSEQYTVREDGGKVKIYDIDDNVIASFPKGTDAAQAIESHFNPKSKTATTPKTDPPPAKSMAQAPVQPPSQQPAQMDVEALRKQAKSNAAKQPPKKQEAPPKKEIPASEEPPSMSADFQKRLEELQEKVSGGEDITPAERAELKRLARRSASERDNTPPPEYSIPTKQDKVQYRVAGHTVDKTSNSATVKMDKYDAKEGRWTPSMSYKVVKEGDKFIVKDGTQRRVASYNVPTIEEALEKLLPKK